MAGQDKRKGGGAKTARSEIITVRLDPRLRYLAEVGARVHRRTLSSYIEWAVAQSLSHVDLALPGEPAETLEQAAPLLWDHREPVRLSRLLKAHSHLVTPEEHRLLELTHAYTVHHKLAGMNEAIQSEFAVSHWDALKEAASEGATFEQFLEDFEGAPTLEKVNKAIEAGEKKLQRLKAMKEELQSNSKKT